MGIEKVVVSMRMDAELIEKTRKYAELENRSLSNFIETVLKRYLALLEEKEKA